MLYLLALVCFYVANGHMRLIWPTPRNGNDDTPGNGGLTTAPCGGDQYSIDDDNENDNITELEPGLNTIVINPLVAHANYQYRIALAMPGNTEEEDDFDECILVDHVPQFDQNTLSAESLHINVTIPNVDCDECTLQVTMLASNGPCCSRYDTTCIGTIYHSCATVKINGKKGWGKRECEQPCVWGWRDYPENHYGGAQDNSYWMLDGTELWLDYEEGYMAPNDTCCEKALGNKGCDDTENDKCKWFEADSNSNSGKSSSGYSSSEKKSGEQAGIAIFIILVVAIGGTIGYTYFFKKKPLNQDNGALIMATTTPTGNLRSQTLGSIQQNVVRDDTNYVTSGEPIDVKPMPTTTTTTGYTQPPVPPPRKEEPVYEQDVQQYEPQQYQSQEYQQQPNDYQPEPEQYQPEPEQYQTPQQYEDPQQQYYEEPEVDIPEMENYDQTPQYDENQYQNDDNQPTDGYDM